MDKLSLKLEKINTKIDLKLILSFVNTVLGILRGLIEAKQGDPSVKSDVIDH